MNKILNSARCAVMGIVNVTPDSFSDGGQFLSPEKAIAHGLKLCEEGADILDIGGESTRPNAQALSPAEEQARILPVIQGLKGKAKHLCVDTRNASTMAAALKAGATMINDISALRHDPESLKMAAGYDGPLVLMHMKGTPETMQKNPYYEDVVEEVIDFFEERIATCLRAGISKDRLILDVGIGFGKTVHHNLALLRHLEKFNVFGCPLLLGVSRKSFIGTLSQQEDAAHRLPGSLAAGLWGVGHGIKILRVHDVHETVQALKVHHAISSLS